MHVLLGAEMSEEEIRGRRAAAAAAGALSTAAAKSAQASAQSRAADAGRAQGTASGEAARVASLQAVYAASVPASSFPKWIIPVGIGGAVVVFFLARRGGSKNGKSRR